ncbi:MAG: PepSY-like domain-containing protein [Prevotella sp.]|nr:PepSY-like domain-containing protein [Prevotella sp.]
MKKSVLYLAALICMMMQSVSTFANDRMIPSEQLPAAAKTFIQKTFPGQTIAYAQIDYDDFGKSYEVRLNNGTKVEFDSNGTWDNVDCYYSAIPADLVPAAIANYVKKNYAGTKIVKIDKERYGYEVELSNDMDLKFDKQGQLVDIDD